MTDVFGRSVDKNGGYKFRKKSDESEFEGYLRLYFEEFCREIARIDAKAEYKNWGSDPPAPVHLKLEFDDYISRDNKYQIDSELQTKVFSLRQLIRKNAELKAEATKRELLSKVEKQRQEIDSG